jgi:plastocyanin
VTALVVVLTACRGATGPAPSELAGATPAETAPAPRSTAKPTPGTSGDATRGESPAPSSAAVEITIGTPASNATLYLPDRASVASGETVRLVFVNSSNTPHNVTFDEPINAATDPYIEAGRTGDVTFTAPAAAGDYAFYCTLHPWMTGTLTVTP